MSVKCQVLGESVEGTCAVLTYASVATQWICADLRDLRSHLRYVICQLARMSCLCEASSVGCDGNRTATIGNLSVHWGVDRVLIYNTWADMVALVCHHTWPRLCAGVGAGIK